MKFKKREFFSIPNLLVYFRVFLIPVFCVIYLKAESNREYYLATGVIALSAFTDFLDGQIARRFDMITEWGKLIDPIADKLTHFAIAICLSLRFKYMVYLVIVMVLKEGYMVVMNAIHYRHGVKLDGAKMFGKICTTTFFLILAVMVLFPSISDTWANILIIVQIAIMLITWALYIPVFNKMKEQW